MGMVESGTNGATNGHGGDSTTSGAARTLKSYAPATGEVLGEAKIFDAEAVQKVVDRARAAQAAWGVLPIEERCERLLRLRDAFVERASEIVDIVSRECGKPRNEALAHEVLIVAELITYYCKRAPKILAPQRINLRLFKHKKSTVHFVPRGVVGIISPWNYPFSIPMGDVVAALITGSAAVVKPSEVTPLTMLKAKEIFDSTGLPEDLFGVVTGEGATGSALIDSGIQKLVFTGGVETGKKVAAACGARLVPCVMELGGKAPLIACADCDVERTARAIVFGGFANAGQACISVERVYAHTSVYDALIARTRELAQELKVGDPAKDFVDVGAIIFPKQIEVAEKHIADAVKKGAIVVIGGKRIAGAGQFFEPTILANCSPSMTVMNEEIFGPIVPFQKVDSEDEAIALANDSHLGLNAYVFTKNRSRGDAIAQKIEAGSVIVNDVLINYAVADAPFGGVKQSGFGRVHGDDALRDMAERRHIMNDKLPAPKRDPLWYPYDAASFHRLATLFRTLYGGSGVLGKISDWFS
ncbi:MAG: aldehyde dehydrogenase family protein [Polyangiaceae bacterium]